VWKTITQIHRKSVLTAGPWATCTGVRTIIFYTGRSITILICVLLWRRNFVTFSLILCTWNYGDVIGAIDFKSNWEMKNLQSIIYLKSFSLSMVKCIKSSKSYKVRILSQFIYSIKLSFLNVCIFLALINNVPIKNQFIILIWKATRFGYTRQSSSEFTLQKYVRKGHHTAVVVHPTVEN